MLNPVKGWSKRSQLRGPREFDEQRRTGAVRWSEAIERNEADEPFSTACDGIEVVLETIDDGVGIERIHQAA